MKTLYNTGILSAILILLIAAQCANAQKVEFLTANNVNAGIGIGGNLFSKLDSLVINPNTVGQYLLFEVPKGSDKRAIRTFSLCFSAQDTGNNLHCAAQFGKTDGTDFYDGPIANTYDSAYDSYFKRVFKVTRKQIEYFKTLLSPNIPDSLIDPAILYWPARHNPYVRVIYGQNISSVLAPYHDIDNDQNYNPHHGDYPAICGDEAVFFVYNDARGPHTYTSSSKIGIEVRGLAYVYNDSSANTLYTKNAINNTVFVKYEIENKSSNDYPGFYTGLFEDPDLGCYGNDRVGCDPNQNLMFVYNSDSIDPDCVGETGYHNIRTAHGVKLLNNSLSSFMYYPGSGPGVGLPVTCSDQQLSMTAHWVNGTHLVQGGDGFMSGGPQTNYAFPGNPNSLIEWTDYTSTNAPGDRSMYGSIGPSSFNAGEIKSFDLAFFSSYDSTSTFLNIVDTLKRDADIIQNFYGQNFCRYNMQGLEAKNLQGNASVIVFPNPAKNLVSVNAVLPMQSVELFDMNGRSIMLKSNVGQNCELSVSAYSKGIYLLKVKCDNQTTVKKLVIE